MNKITDRAHKLDDDIKAVGRLFDSETSWTIKKLLDYQHGLFTFSKFKKGDRVELAVTPDINSKDSWGWMGSKHFLVEGARGVVRSVDYDTEFSYDIEFDDETCKDSDGAVHPPHNGEKHVYCFRESKLRALTPRVCITCGCKK